jgi:hypothetical protein
MAKSNSDLPRAQFVPNTARICGHSRLITVSISFTDKQTACSEPLRFRLPAGHASSILVTRSPASFLVRSTFSLPNIFEHPGDNNDQADHVHFMIIAGDESKCLVGRDFIRPASWVCEVDQAGSVPNSCPIVTSFSFRKGCYLRIGKPCRPGADRWHYFAAPRSKSACGAGDTKRSQEASRR